MKAYCFFSVHIELFDRVARELRATGHATSVSGFAWGRHVLKTIDASDVPYQRAEIVSFTRDIVPRLAEGPVDYAFLERRERELGISLRRAIAAERHLLEGRTYEQVLRLVQVGLEVIGDALDRIQPDYIFTEDISCLMSTLHWALARERDIPFWCVGSARLTNRLSVYRSGFQNWERVLARYAELETLTDAQAELARAFVAGFRDRPRRPTGMQTRSRVPVPSKGDVRQLVRATAAHLRDRRDPTAVSGARAIGQRLTRWQRMARAKGGDIFEAPVEGERFVLFPIHFQPEASTLVQAPMYLNQLALIEDIARSLPVGVRLYVKEHLSNRGRRPLSFYRDIKRVCGTRLLGPDEDTWALIQRAEAIAVITGTMGWEGLLYDKPVVVFGDAFYAHLPGVYRALDEPKDRWFALFSRAMTEHEPDHEALHRYIVALHETSFPGFMKNPNTFPQVLAPENVSAIAAALRAVLDEEPPATPVRPHHVAETRGDSHPAA
ncbi:MAG: hypothetical protein VYE22_11750 [Myxococcota bacterium]|nr:hypothetical protein [Myxococcota bacterium]